MKGQTNAIGTPADAGIEVCTINLTLDGAASSELNNASVVILDADTGTEDTYAYSSQGIVAPITAGHNYTITCKRKGIYVPPKKYSAIAIKDFQRSVTLNYATAPTGVYIYTMDEQLVESLSGTIDDVFGIYVGTADVKLVLSKELLNSGGTFSYINKLSRSDMNNIGFSIPLSDYDELQDFEGQLNTQILVAAYSDKKYAHTAANNYIFPDGRRGFLGAAGQAKIVMDNFSLVRAAYSLIGAVFNFDTSGTGDTLAASSPFNDGSTYKYCIGGMKPNGVMLWSSTIKALAFYDFSI